MIAEALEASPLFALLPATDAAAFARPLHAPPQAVLLRRGEIPASVLLIRHGAVDLVAASPMGRLGPGEVVGLDALFSAEPLAFDAVAATAFEGVALDAAGLLAFLDARADILHAMIGILSEQLRDQIRQIADLKLHSCAERLAGFLATLTPAQRDAVVTLPCDKQRLARRLGMEPATLSRAFARLRAIGVHAGRGARVVIEDVAALRRLAGGSDS
ncbi:MAG: Crp/Fnr family transcriptional regulator [Alphaproteobacteria bacterium]|nr:Crp/Fnr family transcriptional regulator [Alphaproteobacteria bacterium]